ncbi:hypothetical protein LM597_04325 [Candidatus Acetothermia bacterium]|jgi:hypothetical protein|nr:hypothetical protein [Candidatus Acetothermia bacterium]MCI2426615.1 hypothetical protein [Candidatus Acetothermia bacterium]MCI2427896.1 hypothetical protein [Candidatus Acetothermia bacterium]MCI2428095.1 hypothetical protein [Candidatus Acetothermia bacterium]
MNRASIIKIARKILAILMIMWGIFALVTPLTPASWLILIGLSILLGRRVTLADLQKRLPWLRWNKKEGDSSTEEPPPK